MHNKFIIFGDEDVMTGSFNITFDRWWANWESGMAFRSRGVRRLFDNIFQSVRGGVIQRYGIDPYSHFNLLYTFGRHTALNGKNYRPHHAIISEIHRAKHSIKLVLFLIGELRGEHHDSVIDALIHAHRRGVDVKIILNGHLARQGSPGKEHPMAEELKRPLLPSIMRLKEAGIPVALGTASMTSRCPIRPFIQSIASSTIISCSKEALTGITPPCSPTTSSSSPPTIRSPSPICSSSTRS